MGWVLNLYSCFLFCSTVPRITFNKQLNRKLQSGINKTKKMKKFKTSAGCSFHAITLNRDQKSF